jgi:hypothetical protein
MRSAVVCSALLLLFALGGCGTKGLAPVSGTVTLDGQPLPDASVNFQPLDSTKSGLGSSGKTDASGRYSLRVVMDDKTGAVIGKHRVSISTVTEEDPSYDPPPGRFKRPLRDRLPARYNAKSQLEFEVTRGGTDKADFSLTSKHDPPTKAPKP